MNAIFNTLTHSYLRGGYGVIPTSREFLFTKTIQRTNRNSNGLSVFVFLLNYKQQK